MKLTIFALFLFAIAGLTGCERTSTDELVSQAEQQTLQGDLPDAITKLKFALRESPSHARARQLLGNLYLSFDDGASAEKELRRSLDNGGTSGVVYPMLAKALILQKKYEETLQLEQDDSFSEGAAGALLSSHLIAFVGLGDMAAAEQIVSELGSRNVQSAYTTYAKARFLAANEQLDLAVANLKAISRDESIYPRAQKMLGEIYRSNSALEDAETAFTNAIETVRRPTNEYLLRGLSRLSLGDIKGSLADAERAKKIAPDNPVINLLYGQTLFLHGRVEEAAEALEASFLKNNQQFQTAFALAQVQGELGNTNRARGLAEHAHRLASGHIGTRKLLAFYKLEDQDYESVISLVKPIVDARPDDESAARMLASAMLESGNLAEARDLFERLVQLDAKSSEALAGLGVSQLKMGDVDKGLSSLSGAVEIDPTTKKLNELLVVNLINKARAEQAASAAKRFVDADPDNLDALDLYAIALRFDGLEEEAVQVESQILEADPAYEVVAVRRVKELSRAEQYGEAAVILDRAIDKDPRNVRLLLMRTSLLNVVGDKAGYNDALVRIIDRHPDEMIPRVWLAEEFIAERNFKKASAILEGVDSTALAFLLSRAKASYGLGDFNAARRDLELLKTKFNRSIDILTPLADIYRRAGDTQQLKDVLAEILNLTPENDEVRLSLIDLHLRDAAPIDVVNRLYARVVDQSRPDAIRTKAMIALRAGDSTTALEIARQLHDGPDRDSESVLLYGMALAAVGSPDAALIALDEWIQADPDDIKVLEAAAQLSADLGDKQGAMRYLRSLVKSDNSNLYALNSLAVSLKSQDPQAALTYASRARELDPDSPTVLAIHADVLASAGYFDRAVDEIDRAIARSDDPLEPSLRKIGMLLLKGDAELAENELNSLERRYRVPSETAAKMRRQIANLLRE